MQIIALTAFGALPLVVKIQRQNEQQMAQTEDVW